MNKGPIAQCHKSSYQIENWPTQPRNGAVFHFLFLRLLPPGAEESHLQKTRKKKRCPGKCRPFGLLKTQPQSNLPQTPTRSWSPGQNPSPTVQPWRDCWCPSPCRKPTPHAYQERRRGPRQRRRTEERTRERDRPRKTK